jgi:hypothetical protein
LWEILMTHLRSLSPCKFLFPGSLFLGALLASGCGDASGVGRTLPVAGMVTLDGKPLTAGSTVILFKPDAGRGNTSPFEPVGTVDDQGNYTLATKGKRGAPPGWYKVVVTATELRAGGRDPHGHIRPAPRSLVPARYGQAATTTVTIEVVEEPGPGAYDVKLTGK